MFRRQPKPAAPAPISSEEQYRNLQHELDEQKRLNGEYRALLEINAETFAQVQTVLRDLERNAPHLNRPTIQSLLDLEIETLAALPMDLMHTAAGAGAELTRFVHRPATDYLSPAAAAAELLKYRVHTVLQILSKVIQGENVGPSDVTYQAHHDIEVLNTHERYRHNQRIAEHRALSKKQTVH